jgi:hypothetical protein
MTGSSSVVVAVAISVSNAELELVLATVLVLMPVLILVVDRGSVGASLVLCFFALRTSITDIITPNATRKATKARMTKNQRFWRYQGTAAFWAVSSGIW